jgi:hypothetical protein
MRHFFWALLAAPLLLAPVRFQQGSESLILTPSQAPTGPRGTPAVMLPSPTLGPAIIQVSPTRAPLPTIPSDTSFPVQVTLPAPTSPSTPSPTLVPSSLGMPATQAAICVRALSMVNDIAALSMEQSGRENLVPLTIAAAIAQVQAAQGNWPNLAPLRAEGVPFFTPNRAELRQALGYAASFCQNPVTAERGQERVTRPR